MIDVKHVTGLLRHSPSGRLREIVGYDVIGRAWQQCARSKGSRREAKMSYSATRLREAGKRGPAPYSTLGPRWALEVFRRIFR
jgi:hypothetical protein